MKDRDAKVYWFKNRDILIFDKGYGGGDIHIYEKIDQKDATELEQQLKNYGYHEDWDIVDSNTTLGIIKANLEALNDQMTKLRELYAIHGEPLTRSELEQTRHSISEINRVFQKILVAFPERK